MSDQNKIQLKNNDEVVTVPQQDTESVEILPNASAANVDQVEKIKQVIADNKGHILAAMLKQIPYPVTKPIQLAEFCDCFDLAYTPDKTIAGKLSEMSAPLFTWLEKFGFSYENTFKALSKINSASDFDNKLADVANSINNRQSNDTFRKLF